MHEMLFLKKVLHHLVGWGPLKDQTFQIGEKTGMSRAENQGQYLKSNPRCPHPGQKVVLPWPLMVSWIETQGKTHGNTTRIYTEPRPK